MSKRSRIGKLEVRLPKIHRGYNPIQICVFGSPRMANGRDCEGYVGPEKFKIEQGEHIDAFKDSLRRIAKARGVKQYIVAMPRT